MKHPTQVPEEVVSRFINESMRTKTMMEAKKKAKKPKTRDYDYSDEEGAGKRERQEMHGDHQKHEGELQNEEGVRDLAKKAVDKVRGSRTYRKLRVLGRRGGALNQAAKKAKEVEDAMGESPFYTP